MCLVSHLRSLSPFAPGRRHSFKMPPKLTAIATPSSAAAVGLSGSEAVLAVHGTITSWLKRHRGLLPTCGTCNRRALRFAPVVSSPSALLVFLSLSTTLAPFRSRIATFQKKCLILARKSEFPTAVATSQLQIRCHTSLSPTVKLYARSQERSYVDRRHANRLGRMLEPVALALSP